MTLDRSTASRLNSLQQGRDNNRFIKITKLEEFAVLIRRSLCDDSPLKNPIKIS